MTYGAMLEKRRLGTYYFRQTKVIDGRQVTRRFSLRTKDVRVARYLALQLRAQIAMADIPGVPKFHIEYDDQQRIKSVTTTDEADSHALDRFLAHQARERALDDQRHLALVQARQVADERTKAAYAESPEAKEKIRLHQMLESKLVAQPAAVSGELAALFTKYMDDVTAKQGTRDKYRNTITKVLAYAASKGVTTLQGIDRKFAHAYRLQLRSEGRDDSTVKNIFSTVSVFFNRMIVIGEIDAKNPFVGHDFKVKTSVREPFDHAELEKIFSDEELKADRELLFIALLQLTSGARPNEICQLWTDDFDDVGDFYTIRITSNASRDQSLKTAASKRVIYLHRLLIEAGFVAFLKERTASVGTARVFSVTRPTRKTFSTFVSERFSRHLRRLGIATKTMYCFRHTANNRMKVAMVNTEVRSDMLGHEGSNTNERVYTLQFVAEALRARTESALSYEDVPALTKLRVTGSVA